MTKTEIGQKMAEIQLQKDQLEQEKKDVAKGYTEKINALDARLTALAHQYLDEEDQLDAFDDNSEIEEAQIVDESKMLKSGLELPESTEEESIPDPSYDVVDDYIDYGVTYDFLTAKEEITRFGLIRKPEDLELFGILDYDKDLAEESKDKLMLQFKSGVDLRCFLTEIVVGRLVLKSRFGNYLMLAPLEVKEEVE